MVEDNIFVTYVTIRINDYSDFSKVTFAPSSLIDTIHSTESPFSRLNKSLIVLGIDVDNVPPVDLSIAIAS